MSNVPPTVTMLRQRGYCLIPCGADKKPLVRWTEFQTRQPTDAELESWAQLKTSCWAVVTGKVSGVVVLDFDGPEGAQTLQTLGLNPHIQTPSGGYHVYVALPDGVTVRTVNAKSDRLLGELFPSMDVRGDGGYAIVCGRNGEGVYKCLRKLEPLPFESLPYELREYLTGNPNHAKAKRLLEKALSKAVVGCRNDVGFELACALRDAGVPESVARGVMREYASRVPQSGEAYTVDEALASLAQAYKREPAKKQSAPAETRNTNQRGPDGFSLTDLGNAERLVAKHGESLRFDVDSGKWLTWNGKRWERDETGEVDRMAHSTIRDLYALLPTLDRNASDALYAHIKKSESAQRLQAMTNLAAKLSGVPVRAAELDANPWLLCCRNGTLDLRTGELREHRREDLITRMVDIDYNPDANAPVWERFLSEVFGGDSDLIDFVQRAAGYSLTGETSEQCFFLLHGSGSNGKSTFLNVLREVLSDYHRKTPTDTLLDRDTYGIPNDIARLCGARIVTAIEAKPGRRLAETLIKELCGGDAIAARFLHREFFEFVPQFKLWIACNHLPVIEAQDHAIWRRVRLIPFTRQFNEPNAPNGPYRDKLLPHKLRLEYTGILKWLVDGCLKWQSEGLSCPNAVAVATQEYQTEMDVLGDFITECCVIGREFRVKASSLYESYRDWATAAGEKHPLSANAFGRRVLERGTFQRVHTRTGKYWLGIGLKTDGDNPENGQRDGCDGFFGNSRFSENSPFMREKPENCSESVTSVTASEADPVQTAIYPAEEHEMSVDEADWNSLFEHEPEETGLAKPVENPAALSGQTGLANPQKVEVAKPNTTEVAKPVVSGQTPLEEVYEHVRALGRVSRTELIAAFADKYSERSVRRYIERLVSDCRIAKLYDRSDCNKVFYEPVGQTGLDKPNTSGQTGLDSLAKPADETDADQPDLPDKPADDDRLNSSQAALRQVHWYATTFRATRTELVYAFRDTLTEDELDTILDQLIADGYLRTTLENCRTRYESTGFPLPEEPVDDNIPDVIPQPNAETLPYVCQNPKCKQDVVLTVWKRKVNKEPLCYRYLCTHCGHDGLCTVADYEYWLKREAMFARIRTAANKVCRNHTTREPDKADGRLTFVVVGTKPEPDKLATATLVGTTGLVGTTPIDVGASFPLWGIGTAADYYRFARKDGGAE